MELTGIADNSESSRHSETYEFIGPLEFKSDCFFSGLDWSHVEHRLLAVSQNHHLFVLVNFAIFTKNRTKGLIALSDYDEYDQL